MRKLTIFRKMAGRDSAKSARKSLRVDFTPMVDMNMLLITFFMFCTTLSVPQVMDIVMPSDVVEPKKSDQIPASRTITVLLGENDKIFYYFGEANYKDYNSLQETTFAPSGGLRDIILEKNKTVVAKMRELRLEKKKSNMTYQEFKDKASKIKAADDGAIVVIKPTEKSSYANLVNTLDEMAICSVGKYAIVDVAEGDKFLMENYEKKGGMIAQAIKK